MIFLSQLILAIVTVLEMIFQMILFLVVIRCILSWFSPDPYNQLVQTIYRVTDPMLRPIRRITGRLGGGLDISPIILGVILVLIQIAVLDSLKIYAVKMAQ